MTDTSTAAAPAAPSAFAEIDTVLNWLDNALPTVVNDVSIFDPAVGASVTPFIKLFRASVAGVNSIAADEAAGGKTLPEVIQDATIAVANTFAPPPAAAPVADPASGD